MRSESRNEPRPDKLAAQVNNKTLALELAAGERVTAARSRGSAPQRRPRTAWRSGAAGASRRLLAAPFSRPAPLHAKLPLAACAPLFLLAAVGASNSADNKKDAGRLYALAICSKTVSNTTCTDMLGQPSESPSPAAGRSPSALPATAPSPAPATASPSPAAAPSPAPAKAPPASPPSPPVGEPPAEGQPSPSPDYYYYPPPSGPGDASPGPYSAPPTEAPTYQPAAEATTKAPVSYPPPPTPQPTYSPPPPHFGDAAAAGGPATGANDTAAASGGSSSGSGGLSKGAWIAIAIGAAVALCLVAAISELLAAPMLLCPTVARVDCCVLQGSVPRWRAGRRAGRLTGWGRLQRTTGAPLGCCVPCGWQRGGLKLGLPCPPA